MMNIDSKRFRALDGYFQNFYKCLLKQWLEIDWCNKENTTRNSSQSIWNNAFLKYRNIVLYYKRWNMNDIICVSHIFANGTLVSCDVIARKLEYNAMANTIENMFPE